MPTGGGSAGFGGGGCSGGGSGGGSGGEPWPYQSQGGGGGTKSIPDSVGVVRYGPAYVPPDPMTLLKDQLDRIEKKLDAMLAAQSPHPRKQQPPGG